MQEQKGTAIGRPFLFVVYLARILIIAVQKRSASPSLSKILHLEGDLVKVLAVDALDGEAVGCGPGSLEE